MIGFLFGLITPISLVLFLLLLLLASYILSAPTWFNMPPGPSSYPVLGSLFEFMKKPGPNEINIFQPLARKYGKLFHLKLGMVNAIVINDFDTLHEAFVKKGNIFNDRAEKVIFALKFFNERFGRGIANNSGTAWKQLRRTSLIAMKDFGMGKQSLEEMIQDETRILLDSIRRKNSEPFIVKSLFNLVTSNIICTVIFGSRFDYSDDTFKDLLRVMDDSLIINPFILPVNFIPFLRYIPFFKKKIVEFMAVYQLTSDFIKKLVAKSENSFDPDNIRDFVDLFIKKKKENKDDSVFTEKNLQRAIVDLFVAGSDTTANTLNWLMVMMAKFPDIQTHCQEEIKQVLGEGKMASSADRDKLPYVEATILEVLRMRLPAPLGVLHCTNQATELEGYHIPGNTLVLSNLFAINNDPKTFPEPDIFRPEHFLDDQGGIINRNRMVSFSIGPRVCPGESLARQELLIVFTSILQFFRISPKPGNSINTKAYQKLFLTSTPQELVFTPRSE